MKSCLLKRKVLVWSVVTVFSFVCRYLAYSIIKYVLGLDCIQVSFTVVHHVIDYFSMHKI
jgi:hypothetical protein